MTAALDTAANVATIIGLPAGLLAVVFAIIQLRHSRHAASAGLLVTFHQAIQTHWREVKEAGPEDKARRYALSDMMNTFEAACACYLDSLFASRTEEILRDLLRDYLEMFNDNDDARRYITGMIDKPDTLANVREFLRREKLTGLFQESAVANPAAS